MDCSQIEGPTYLCGKLVPAIRPKQAWGTVNRVRRPVNQESIMEGPTGLDVHAGMQNPAFYQHCHQGAPDEPTALRNCMQDRDEKEISYLNYDLGHAHTSEEHNGHVQACFGINEQQFECLRTPNEPGSNYAQAGVLHDPSELRKVLKHLPRSDVSGGEYPMIVNEMGELTDPLENELCIIEGLLASHQVADRQQPCMVSQNPILTMHAAQAVMPMQTSLMNNILIHQTMEGDEQGLAEWKQGNVCPELQTVQAACSEACGENSKQGESIKRGNISPNGVVSPIYLDPPIHAPIQHKGSMQTPQTMKSASTQTGHHTSPVSGPARNYDGPVTVSIKSIHNEQLQKNMPKRLYAVDEIGHEKSTAAMLSNREAVQCGRQLGSPGVLIPTVRSMQNTARPSGAHINRHGKAIVDQVTYFEPVQPQLKEAEEVTSSTQPIFQCQRGCELRIALIGPRHILNQTSLKFIFTVPYQNRQKVCS